MKIHAKKNSLIILFCTLALAIFGCVMVYSASKYSATVNYGDEFFYLKKQILGVVIGLVGLIICSFVNHKVYRKFYWIFYFVGLVFLILVFIPGLSRTSYGATRWIGIGSFTIQPSEIAKFCLVFFLAGYLADGDKLSKVKHILITLSLGGAYCILIMLEPNMSITMCVAFTLIFMLFIGGMRLKVFGMMIVPAIALVVVLILMEPYRLSRLVAFINPWENPLDEGYQLIQSLYAIGSGGVWGVGLFNSRQAELFLPFSESDFIFSITAEELGFIGCIVLCMIFLTLIITIFKVGMRAANKFSAFLCFGIAAIISIQVVLNIAVVTGSIPPTGLPLPFISAGSTSLLVFMSAIGVVLNVDRQSRKGRI
ncbi:MAG: putative lipid II flippase FtsW [Clostridiales bacterium]|nr:putative lipid II flippase FtsW [Clostridiales bacterium]